MKNCKTLDELFEEMRTSDENTKWDNLPTFGGVEPEDTTETWSWDADRKIAGTCPFDIEIVNR